MPLALGALYAKKTRPVSRGNIQGYSCRDWAKWLNMKNIFSGIFQLIDDKGLGEKIYKACSKIYSTFCLNYLPRPRQSCFVHHTHSYHQWQRSVTITQLIANVCSLFKCTIKISRRNTTLQDPATWINPRVIWLIFQKRTDKSSSFWTTLMLWQEPNELVSTQLFSHWI